MRDTEREVETQAEGENLQAHSSLSVEPDLGLNPRTHAIMTWAKTKSWTLNWLSHLGTPVAW